MSTQIRDLQQQMLNVTYRLDDLEGSVRYLKRLIGELEDKVEALKPPPPVPPPVPVPPPPPPPPSPVPIPKPEAKKIGKK